MSHYWKIPLLLVLGLCVRVCVCVCAVVARFAGERVQPLVKKMDDESQMDPSIISDMFDQGVSEAMMLCCVCRVQR